MKTVVIVRGPSGSGKSTLVRNNYRDVPHDYFSADLFFTKVYAGKPEYKFDPSKLSQAHAECMNKFIHALYTGSPLIVIDNTFTHNWEWKNYEAAAVLAGYSVEVLEIRIRDFMEARLCVSRNQHGVPAATVYTMCCEFEPCNYAKVYWM